ncbi:Translation_elongation factor [Hexamita inflata]|uniref:Translation_elongation factor n=1 Tax=Hexamita inflata TaxID=28002 RepID=A0ABP1KSE4_9EUKA
MSQREPDQCSQTEIYQTQIYDLKKEIECKKAKIRQLQQDDNDEAKNEIEQLYRDIDIAQRQLQSLYHQVDDLKLVVKVSANTEQNYQVQILETVQSQNSNNSSQEQQKIRVALFIRCKTCGGQFCIQDGKIEDSDAYQHIRGQKHEIDVDFEINRRFEWEKTPDSSDQEIEMEYQRQCRVCQVGTDDKSQQFKMMNDIENQVAIQLQSINKIETQAFINELEQKADLYLDPENINQKKRQFLMIESNNQLQKKIQKMEKKFQKETNQTSHQVKKRNKFSLYSLNQRKNDKEQEIQRIQLQLQQEKKNLDENIQLQEKFIVNEARTKSVMEKFIQVRQQVDKMKKCQLSQENQYIIKQFQNELTMYLNNINEKSLQIGLSQIVQKLFQSSNSKIAKENAKLTNFGLDEIQLLINMHYNSKFFDEGKKKYDLKLKQSKYFENLVGLGLLKNSKNQEFIEEAKQIKIILKTQIKIKQLFKDIFDYLQKMSKRSIQVTFNMYSNLTVSQDQNDGDNKEQTNITVEYVLKDVQQSVKLSNQPVPLKLNGEFKEVDDLMDKVQEKLLTINEYSSIPDEIINNLKIQIENSEKQLELTKTYVVDSWQKKLAEQDINENQNRKLALETNDISKFIRKRHISVVFCGHVHHGKSTLSQQIILESIQDPKERDLERQHLIDQHETMAGGLNSLPEERKTGNTIEYAKRQFDTIGGRNIMLLDAPGHENYILSMIEAATQADIGVLLTSAKQGEFSKGTSGANRVAEKRGQTLEHAQILHTCGVSTLIVVINKIDDVSCQEQPQQICQNIVNTLGPQLVKIGFKKDNITFIPVSAKTNVNVCKQLQIQDVGQNPHTEDINQRIFNFKFQQFQGEQSLNAWYQGLSLMDAIDKVKVPFRDIGGFVRVMVTSKKRQGQQYLVECKVEKGQLNIKDNDFVLMPINTEIQLESKQCEIVFPGDQCVVSVDKITYQQIKIGDVICKKGQECQTQMEFYIALCCVESTVISRGYKAMIHVGGIITEFEVVKVVGVLDDAGILNSKINIFGTGERAILKIRVLGRKNPICVSTFERDEFLGRVLVRHQRTTVGAGIVIEEWNNKTLKVIEYEGEPEYLMKIQDNRYQSLQMDYKFMYQEKGKNKQNKSNEICVMDPFKIWKMKKYIEAIQTMPSQDCVVTLYIRSSDSPESITKILNTKRTETGNIKSSVTKAAIQSALDKASQFVTSYVKSIPRNGLCVFVGSALIAFEPIQPIVYTGSSLFCDKQFNINPVEELLQPKQKYIFILFDGYTARIYSVCGNSIEILSEIEADIPKKGRHIYSVYYETNRKNQN